jgi:2-oxoglutarate dehydrogenase E2 component (dihydrolipoamide succinyltransferase)
MAVEIKVPSVGESVTEGTLSRWLKSNGDFVRADEPVFELETEKATQEVPAPAAGALKILVPEGQTIAIGAVVGHIEAVAAKDKETRRQRDKQTKKAIPEDGAPARPATSVAPAESRETDVDLRVSPAARKLAAEQELDVHALKGSGRGGLVTKEDVLALGREEEPAGRRGDGVTGRREKSREAGDEADHREKPETRPAVAPSAGESVTAPAPQRETRQRMSSIRQRIAEHLVSSQQTTATLTTFNEADMSGVMALRNQYKDRFKDKFGTGLGFMSFFVKACVEALRAFPSVNARIDSSDIVYQHFYDIGVAVSTERGLMVPVLRDADRLSFAQIEKQIAEMAQKARDGKITVNDLQGGTFTITNGGVFGSLVSTPILNPPQSAILGMHAIQKRPVAINDQVVIRPMMYLALSYDHRLIDGREAVLFLVRVKECIENPERLLLEV